MIWWFRPMSFPRRIAEVFGVNSRLVRWLRPAREYALDVAYGRSGLTRAVNGVPFRVLPRYRWAFVADHDHAVAAYFRERVKPGQVCFSVGANLGVYALQFAHWAGPEGKVYAFEPNLEAAAVLRRHIALNGLGGRVRLV